VTDHHPALAATLSRVAAGQDWCRFVAGEPGGPGWFGLDELHGDPALLHGWLDELLTGEAQGRREVAGSYLTLRLGAIVAGPLAVAVMTERRAWPVEAAALAIHRDPAEWFDGVAVRRPALCVLPDDPAAAGPGVHVVSDVAALHQRVAAGLVAVLGPLFALLRRPARVGTPGMWGAVADAIAGAALSHDRRQGGNGDGAWRAANLLIDAVQRAAPLMRARPTLERVTWSSGVAHFAVRGTCCLFFKVSGCPRDPRGDAYCTSCPFRDAADRRQRWAAWLDAQAASEREAARA
jgi:hypothetical protein